MAEDVCVSVEHERAAESLVEGVFNCRVSDFLQAEQLQSFWGYQARCHIVQSEIELDDGPARIAFMKRAKAKNRMVGCSDRSPPDRTCVRPNLFVEKDRKSVV